MRTLILFALTAAACLADGPATTSIRGKLTQRDGKPALDLSDHKMVPLDGDEPTRGVLKDKRLAGADLEATGHYSAPDLFTVDPIHTTAMPADHPQRVGH